MLNAKEAREVIDKGKYQKAQEQMKEIEELIENAIKNGKFMINGEGTLETSNRQVLEKLGYKISTGSQYNEIYYSISW